jgi:hypothetical protein
VLFVPRGFEQQTLVFCFGLRKKSRQNMQPGQLRFNLPNLLLLLAQSLENNVDFYKRQILESILTFINEKTAMSQIIWLYYWLFISIVQKLFLCDLLKARN